MNINSTAELTDDALGVSLESLDITPNEYRSAVAKYAAAGSFLADYWDQTDGGVIYAQGSMNLGTVTRIFNRNDEYDLDAVCMRDLAKDSTTQANLKADVGHGLRLFCKSGPDGRPELDDEGKRCWTLLYPGQPFHLDLLPALPDPDATPNGIILTDTRVRTWQFSNPLDYAVWFRGVMMREFIERRATFAKKMDVKDVPEWQVKTTLQRSVQALKRHRDIYFNDARKDRPPSILITTLAGMSYTGGGELYEVLRDITSQLPRHISYADGKPVVLNPVQSLENFAERWHSAPDLADRFYEWAEAARRDFESLGNQRGIDTMITKIASTFGDRAAHATSKALGTSIYKARATGTLAMAAGTGALTTTVGRSVPSHTFRGDTQR